MLGRINQAQSANVHPLAHILGTCVLISVVVLVLQFTQTASRNGILTPLHVISHQSTGGRSGRTQEPSKNGRVKFNHIHMHRCSPLLNIFRAASAAIPLLPKVTYTPSIQPNLDHLVPALNLLPPSTLFKRNCTHPFSPHVQPTSILSDLPHLLAPFVFQRFYALFIPNCINS